MSPSREHVLCCGSRRLHLSRRPHIMAIVNLTPDSFSDGGMVRSPQAAYRRAKKLIAAGADILDLGAESTRPGAMSVSALEEKRRLLPALRRIVTLGVPVSVDTCKPEVASAALEAGACMINDVTALRDEAMRSLAARTQVPVVLMHMRGIPRNMQAAPRYGHVVKDVRRSLLAAAQRAEAAGVKRSQIILDPGIGFGKTTTHNLQLLQGLGQLVETPYPILLGPSRKSFIAAVLGTLPPRERIWGTAAAVALAVVAGVHILRVHDVEAMRMTAQVAFAIRQGKLTGNPKRV